MKRFNLLTLDVFDTCLIRDFVSQESLWYLLGTEVAKNFPGISSPAEFVRLRGSTENEVRSLGRDEDISLNSVYAKISALLGWTPEQQRQAVALEERTENRSLRPNPQAEALLAKAHGASVAYLTDTPHRGAFIRECLDEHSAPAGPVFSSGDLGLRKGTGSLFREATTRLNVNPAQALHIGNDMRSDAAGSARVGMPFAFLPFANPTRYETTLDSVTGELAGLLGAILAGSGRNFRLAPGDESSAGLRSIVSGVAGPTVFAAVAWSLLSAQQDGIDTLYFVARDGELLLEVAKLLQQELGLLPEIECRYLYGSRRSWHLPALSLLPEAEFAAGLRSLLVRSGKTSLREMLSQLDLEADELVRLTVPELAGIPLDAPLTEPVAKVIDALVASSAVQSLVLSRSKVAYAATIAYLRQEKMFNSSRPGLVDIGWHGAASASLTAIAATQGTDVLCYFAGGLCGQESVVAPRGSRAYLIDARGRESEHRQALVHLMESFCAGSGGSTLGYAEMENQWQPRLAPSSTNRAMAWGLKSFHALVSEYISEVCRGLVKFDCKITLAELHAIRPFILSNLNALWNSPSYGDAEAWGSFPFEDDRGTPVLGRAVTLDDLIQYARHIGNAEKRPRFGPWRHATIARTAGGQFTDLLTSVRAVSTPQQRLIIRATVRSKLAFRPVLQHSEVDIRDGVISARRRQVSTRGRRRPH